MIDWIVLGTFIWLGAGFIGRCMAKYMFITRWSEIVWNREVEITFDIMIIGGLIQVGVAVLFTRLIKNMKLGMML
jgi:tetrahydromethanopterin S-methyltransferase subunit E